MMRWLWAVLVVVGLTGCYQELEVREVSGLTDGQLTLQGFNGTMDVRLFNPNRYPVKALDSEVYLFVRDQRVGKVDLTEPVELPAQAESTISLEVASEPGAIAAILKNELMNFLTGGEVELRAEGTVTGKAWGIPVTVPVRAVEQIGLTK
jgi:LEA14-like dessication related protein